MTDVVEFVLARLDEDAVAARAVKPLGHVVDMGGKRLNERFIHGRMSYSGEDGAGRFESDRAAHAHFARHDPARVLDDLHAKRWLVERAAHVMTHSSNHAEVTAWLHVVQRLAVPYGDHSEYRSEWKPADDGSGQSIPAKGSDDDEG